MHRDIKPDNFAIDRAADTFRILDWGLADFYVPAHKANPHAGTRAYMAPEQVIGYQYYNYAIDVWAAGLVLGMMLFKRQLITAAPSGEEQLIATARLVGGRQMLNLLCITEMAVKESWIAALKQIKDAALPKFIADAVGEFRDKDAIDLLQRMLKSDFRFRITAKDALKHPFLRIEEESLKQPTEDSEETTEEETSSD
jgi:casein kinase II subunit alpha